jgi:hypothetical protein
MPGTIAIAAAAAAAATAIEIATAATGTATSAATDLGTRGATDGRAAIPHRAAPKARR